MCGTPVSEGKIPRCPAELVSAQGFVGLSSPYRGWDWLSNAVSPCFFVTELEASERFGWHATLPMERDVPMTYVSSL